MQPSRRAAIGLVGTTTVTLLAGCSAPGFGLDDREETGEPAESGGEAGLTVRLIGPETDRLLFDGTDVRSVGPVRNRTGTVTLPITLTDEATSAVGDAFRTAGVDDAPGEFEIVQLSDGEEVYRAGVTRELAENIAEDAWDGELLLTFQRRERASELREALVNGTTE